MIRHVPASKLVEPVRIETKILTIQQIEEAFREYASYHVGASDEMINTEWQRFKKSLLKRL